MSSPDLLKLPEVLVRQDDAHAVLARLGEHAGYVARQVQLAFVQVEKERSLGTLPALRIEEQEARKQAPEELTGHVRRARAAREVRQDDMTFIEHLAKVDGSRTLSDHKPHGFGTRELP